MARTTTVQQLHKIQLCYYFSQYSKETTCKQHCHTPVHNFSDQNENKFSQ